MQRATEVSQLSFELLNRIQEEAVAAQWLDIFGFGVIIGVVVGVIICLIIANNDAIGDLFVTTVMVTLTTVAFPFIWTFGGKSLRQEVRNDYLEWRIERIEKKAAKRKKEAERLKYQEDRRAKLDERMAELPFKHPEEWLEQGGKR